MFWRIRVFLSYLGTNKGGGGMKDVHHIMNPQRVHEIYPQSAYIRNAMLVRDMPRHLHELLHRNTSPIPLLGYYALQRVARDMQPYYENPLESIDDFSFAVDLANKHPKAKRVERMLGELTVETVREQIPFIRRALYEREATKV
jgi:hypothetical protein